uniref:DUF4157 domain-containing protein n=1 Tax=Ignisphaera aggregans TaxID=334771 RepID=A0A7C2V997_9CREN
MILFIVLTSSISSTLIYWTTPHDLHQRFDSALEKVIASYSLVYEISRDIETLRGMRFSDYATILVVDTSWALKTWAPKEDSEIPSELVYRETLYKLTFLLPYNKSILQKQREWIGMFAAATAGTTLYINIDYFNPYTEEARNVLAHELTHVLQSLYFRIHTPQTLDARLAVLALVEGDAGWTQHLYCNNTGMCKPSPPMMLNLEDLYISLNLFPYIFGERFVKFLYDKGGWGLVNRAYEKPPKSTLMVLKPEIYLDYLVNGTDVVLNVEIKPNENLSCLYSDVLGPYYVMLVLANIIGIEKALDIALNWRGDKALLCQVTNNTKPMFVAVWNTTWSSDSYAMNFYNNLTYMIQQRGYVNEMNTEKRIGVIVVSESSRHVIAMSVKGSNVCIESYLTQD